MDRHCAVSRLHRVDDPDPDGGCSGHRTKRNKGGLCGLQRVVPSDDRRAYGALYGYGLARPCSDPDLHGLRLRRALPMDQTEEHASGRSGYSLLRRLLYPGHLRLPVFRDGSHQLPAHSDRWSFGGFLSFLHHPSGI